MERPLDRTTPFSSLFHVQGCFLLLPPAAALQAGVPSYPRENGQAYVNLTSQVLALPPILSESKSEILTPEGLSCRVSLIFR